MKQLQEDRATALVFFSTWMYEMYASIVEMKALKPQSIISNINVVQYHCQEKCLLNKNIIFLYLISSLSFMNFTHISTHSRLVKLSTIELILRWRHRWRRSSPRVDGPSKLVPVDLLYGSFGAVCIKVIVRLLAIETVSLSWNTVVTTKSSCVSKQ